MEQINLNGIWKLRWCDGQRGGMPHYIHAPSEIAHADVCNIPKEVSDDYDDIKWINAKVPGEVHLDLVEAGIIASPYEGVGALNCRWVEECYWFYRTVFNATDIVGNAFQRLVFEGLDYGAVIYLNGKEIARHENAFYPCEIDVSGLIMPLKNVLLVGLESGLFSVSEKPIRDYFTATSSIDAILHKRNWLRKTQSQTAWDWSPRLLNVGIYKPVFLKCSNSMIIDSVAVNAVLNADLDEGKLTIRAFTSQYGKNLKNIKMIAEMNDKRFEFVYNSVPEDGVFSEEITVEKPDLWWPIGYGEQTLYELKVTLSVEEEEVFTDVKKIGFRHIAVNTKVHEIEGNYFVFEINNVPVFMRGSNLVPIDLISAAMSRDRYEKIIDLAIEANFNFLRIWGGGLYENDDLFDICNEKGIMLWQEFVAACAVIPIKDEQLLESIKKEAVYNIRRLSAHPSLIAWCGNNEIGWGTNHMDILHAREDFELYHTILPEILKAEDYDKYYQPTSPFSALIEDQNSEVTGDQHPWNVGFTNKDSRDYEKCVCRFPNEGGLLGPVSLKTTKACLREGDSIHSFSWQVHDNMLESWLPGSSPDEDVNFWLNKDVRKMSIEEYVFAGGITQAEGLKRYIDNFRRRKYSSSGAVFWMFNDCWPATRSWTIIDYYLNKTPSFHHVRRAFLPVSPVIALEGDSYTIYGVNDTLKDFNGKINYGVFTTDGKYGIEEKLNVTLKANASTEIANISDNIIAAIGAENAFVYAVIYDEAGNMISRTRYNNKLMYELNLPIGNIKSKKTKEGYIFTSDNFVMNACMDLNGDTDVSDNMFDLYPGQPYFVKTKDIKSNNPIIFTLNSFLQDNIQACLINLNTDTAFSQVLRKDG